jgi:hypothetical protein
MHPRVVALIVTAVAFRATLAVAQPFEISRVTHSFGATMTTDAVYDPVHDGYFVITGDPMVRAQFVDRSGRPSGPPMTLDTRRSPYVSRAVYSPDVSDGAGGRGGFLAAWSPTFNGGTVLVQLVTVRGGLVGSPRAIASGFITSADAAYSPVDRVFFVGVRDERGPWDNPARLLRLNLDGVPLEEIALSTVPNASCFHELDSACEVHVEWNPVSGEFGVLYPQGGTSSTANSSVGRLILARIRGDGRFVGRTVLGVSASIRTALSVSTHTGHYLVLTPSNQRAGGVDAIELTPDGTVLAQGLISGNVDILFGGFDFISLRLSYSPASGTFLVGAGTRDAMGATSSVLLQLNAHGVPMFTRPFECWYFGLSSHATAPEWIAACSGLSIMLGTSSPFGGSNEQLSGCITPDPFTSLGGGRCVNRGWLPPGHPSIPVDTPTPLPPFPAPTVCTIPDPFTSLGGGVCVNGGWVPRGHPLAGGGSS